MMDRRVKRDVQKKMVQYLLKATFSTKKDMAAHIGVTYRQLLSVSVGKGSRHSELEVTDHILRYCIKHKIPLDGLFDQ